MSVKLVQAEMTDRSGIVTVQADTQDEALGTPARELVLKEAAKQGLSRPGLSGSGGAYPVDVAGETSDDLMMGKGQVAGYRCDYRVTGAL